MSEIRLGDIIDDHCSRCRLLTNHSVVSLLDQEVKKVRCRTCSHEHDYRHGRAGTRKRQKLSAFDEVLASITRSRFEPPEAGTEAPAKRARRKS